jgi:hypothetical protein
MGHVHLAKLHVIHVYLSLDACLVCLENIITTLRVCLLQVVPMEPMLILAQWLAKAAYHLAKIVIAFFLIAQHAKQDIFFMKTTAL